MRKCAVAHVSSHKLVLAQASYMMMINKESFEIKDVIASYGKYALFKIKNPDSEEEEWVAIKFRFMGNGKLGKHDRVFVIFDDKYKLWYGKHLDSLAEGEQVNMTKEFNAMIMAESLWFKG